MFYVCLVVGVRSYVCSFAYMSFIMDAATLISLYTATVTVIMGKWQRLKFDSGERMYVCWFMMHFVSAKVQIFGLMSGA